MNVNSEATILTSNYSVGDYSPIYRGGISYLVGVIVSILQINRKYIVNNEMQYNNELANKINFNDPLPKLPEIKNKKLKNYLSGKNFFNSYFTAKSTEDRLNKHLIISEFNGTLSQVSIKSGTAVVFGQQIGKFHNPFLPL